MTTEVSLSDEVISQCPLVVAGSYHRMLEADANAWRIFPWSPEDVKNKNPKFVRFAKNFVRMLDMAIHLLGPDMEIVEEQMYDLGKSHKDYGVMPKHYKLMGQALILSLKTILGQKSFTVRTEKAWNEIYFFMSMTMIEGAVTI